MSGPADELGLRERSEHGAPERLRRRVDDDARNVLQADELQDVVRGDVRRDLLGCDPAHACNRAVSRRGYGEI